MPVQVSPLIRGARWSALFVGVTYGAVHNRTIGKRRRKEVAINEKKAEETAQLKAAQKAAEEAGRCLGLFETFINFFGYPKIFFCNYCIHCIHCLVKPLNTSPSICLNVC